MGRWSYALSALLALASLHSSDAFVPAGWVTRSSIRGNAKTTSGGHVDATVDEKNTKELFLERDFDSSEPPELPNDDAEPPKESAKAKKSTEPKEDDSPEEAPPEPTVELESSKPKKSAKPKKSSKPKLKKSDFQSLEAVLQSARLAEEPQEVSTRPEALDELEVAKRKKKDPDTPDHLLLETPIGVNKPDAFAPRPRPEPPVGLMGAKPKKKKNSAPLEPGVESNIGVDDPIAMEPARIPPVGPSVEGTVPEDLLLRVNHSDAFSTKPRMNPNGPKSPKPRNIISPPIEPTPESTIGVDDPITFTHARPPKVHPTLGIQKNDPPPPKPVPESGAIPVDDPIRFTHARPPPVQSNVGVNDSPPPPSARGRERTQRPSAANPPVTRQSANVGDSVSSAEEVVANREHLRDSKKETAKRLSRSQKTAETIAKMKAAAEEKTRKLEMELEEKLQETQTLIDEEVANTIKVFQAEIDYELQRDADILELVSFLQNAINSKEEDIEYCDNVADQMEMLCKELKPGTDSMQIETLLKTKRGLASMERGRLNTLNECMEELVTVLEESRSRTERTKDALSSLVDPETRADTSHYEWNDIENMDKVLEDAADHVLAMEAQIQVLRQRIHSAIVKS